MATADQAYSVTAGIGGAAVVTIQTRTALQTWTIQQVSVEARGAPIGATCDLRLNGSLVTPLIATGDAASGEPPIILRPGSRLTVEFAGLPLGSIANVLVFYDDGQAEA